MKIIKNNPKYCGFVDPSLLEEKDGFYVAVPPGTYSKKHLQDVFKEKIQNKTNLGLYPEEWEYQNIFFDIPLPFLKVKMEDRCDFFHIFHLDILWDIDFIHYTISSSFENILTYGEDECLTQLEQNMFEQWLESTGDEKLQQGLWSSHGESFYARCEVLDIEADCINIYINVAQ